MLNQLDLCGNSAALRKYEDSQVEEIQPTAEAIEAKYQILINRLHDVKDDETINAILQNRCAWERFSERARLAHKTGISGMDSTQRAELCISAIVFWDMVEMNFRFSMRKIAEGMATEEANR